MFSVVIPVYNHAAFLNQAIESALASPLVAEVLLLDDGSGDGSAGVAARAAASVLRVRNLTPAESGNRGTPHRLNELVGAARCDWVAVLNSDDAFVPDRFELISSDDNFSGSDFVFGDLKLIDENGEITADRWGLLDTGTPFPFDVADKVRSGDFLDLLSHQNYLRTTSNMVFRKDLHARIGGFGPYRYVHDWDFALRAMALNIPPNTNAAAKIRMKPAIAWAFSLSVNTEKMVPTVSPMRLASAKPASMVINGTTNLRNPSE